MKEAFLEGVCSKCKLPWKKTISFDTIEELDAQKNDVLCPECEINMPMHVAKIIPD